MLETKIQIAGVIYSCVKPKIRPVSQIVFSSLQSKVPLYLKFKLNQTYQWRAYCSINLCRDWAGEKGRKINNQVSKNAQYFSVRNKFGISWTKTEMPRRMVGRHSFKQCPSREKAVAVMQFAWRARNTPVNYSIMCFVSAQHVSDALHENKKALFSPPLEASESKQMLNPVTRVEMHYNTTSIHKQ